MNSYSGYSSRWFQAPPADQLPAEWWWKGIWLEPEIPGGMLGGVARGTRAAVLLCEAAGFDVVIIDVPDPLEVGPAYLLFTREFYELVRDRLTPEGMVVTQAGPTGPLFHKQWAEAVGAPQAD